MPVASLQMEGVKGVELTGVIDNGQRNIVRVDVTGRDNIEKFADALETAAYRLRAMMAKEG